MFSNGNIGAPYTIIEGITITNIIIFFTSIIILIFNIKRLKNHLDTFLFLSITFPLTWMSSNKYIEYLNYNKKPDLGNSYIRPIDQSQYLKDSSFVMKAIDSITNEKQHKYNDIKILSVILDTMIYSQDGNKIFIVFIKKCAPNNTVDDLNPDYLYGYKSNGEIWKLAEGSYNISGSYHDIKSLKYDVRQYYFNQFKFSGKDSMKANFFWKMLKG